MRKLQLSRARTISSHRKKKARAEKEGKPRDVIDDFDYELMITVELIDEDVEKLESRYLIESAQKLILPTPEISQNSDAWTRSENTGLFRLSKSSMASLRSEIRKERKERREGAMVWIAALTGLVGAFTGLIAIWKS